jgi:hypothetical protein
MYAHGLLTMHIEGGWERKGASKRQIGQNSSQPVVFVNFLMLIHVM